MFRIQQSAVAEQIINKSRFIAAVDYCQDERQVGQALRKLASAHQSAHHLAYAFRIKTSDGIIQRFHDAGEPSGTAGKPILQFIEGRDLINVCVGVIRYYGGVKLGTGGLARAYGGTAKDALEKAGLEPYIEMLTFKMLLEYNQLDYFARELTKDGGHVIDKQFDEKVLVIASAPAPVIEKLQKQFGQRYV